MREGFSASSAAYVRWFFPCKIRKNGGKTAKNVIFHHARQLWLQMGCKWHEEGNADPTRPEVSIANLIDGLLYFKSKTYESIWYFGLGCKCLPHLSGAGMNQYLKK